MSLDRSLALIEEEMIAELACAENGHGPLRVRVYVGEELVLIVTEREPAPPRQHRAAATARPEAGIPEREAAQRRTTVEAVTGRRVAAMLSGRRTVPAVLFELFMLGPDDGGRARHAR
jgi:hypothetical protein